MVKFKRTKSKKRGPVRSKAITVDGIAFKSGLEKNMHLVLKQNGIKNKYEGMTFQLLPGFSPLNRCYERQGNGKGEYRDRGNRKVLGIKYTPDFIVYDKNDNIIAIIETKGRPNDSFPIRWKLFKLLISRDMPEVILFKPQNIAECQETAKAILEELR
jgi:hypothetical protein